MQHSDEPGSNQTKGESNSGLLSKLLELHADQSLKLLGSQGSRNNTKPILKQSRSLDQGDETQSLDQKLDQGLLNQKLDQSRLDVLNDLQSWVKSAESHQRDFDEIQKDMDEREDKLDDAKKVLQDVQKVEVAKKLDTFSKPHKEVGVEKRKLHATSHELKLTHSVVSMKRQVEKQEEIIARLRERIYELEDDLQLSQDKSNDYYERNKILEKILRDKESEMSRQYMMFQKELMSIKSKKNSEKSGQEDQYEKYQKVFEGQMARLNEEILELAKERDIDQARIRQLQTQIDDLKSYDQKKKKEIQQLRERLSAVTVRSDDYSNLVTKLSKEIEEHKQRENSFKTTIQKKVKEIHEKTELAHHYRDKLDKIRNLKTFHYHNKSIQTPSASLQTQIKMRETISKNIQKFFNQHRYNLKEANSARYLSHAKILRLFSNDFAQLVDDIFIKDKNVYFKDFKSRQKLLELYKQQQETKLKSLKLSLDDTVEKCQYLFREESYEALKTNILKNFSAVLFMKDTEISNPNHKRDSHYATQEEFERLEIENETMYDNLLDLEEQNTSLNIQIQELLRTEGKGEELYNLTEKCKILAENLEEKTQQVEQFKEELKSRPKVIVEKPTLVDAFIQTEQGKGMFFFGDEVESEEDDDFIQDLILYDEDGHLIREPKKEILVSKESSMQYVDALKVAKNMISDCQQLESGAKKEEELNFESTSMEKYLGKSQSERDKFYFEIERSLLEETLKNTKARLVQHHHIHNKFTKQIQGLKKDCKNFENAIRQFIKFQISGKAELDFETDETIQMLERHLKSSTSDFVETCSSVVRKYQQQAKFINKELLKLLQQPSSTFPTQLHPIPEKELYIFKDNYEFQFIQLSQELFQSQLDSLMKEICSVYPLKPDQMDDIKSEIDEFLQDKHSVVGKIVKDSLIKLKILFSAMKNLMDEVFQKLRSQQKNIPMPIDKNEPDPLFKYQSARPVVLSPVKSYITKRNPAKAQNEQPPMLHPDLKQMVKKYGGIRSHIVGTNFEILISKNRLLRWQARIYALQSSGKKEKIQNILLIQQLEQRRLIRLKQRKSKQREHELSTLKYGIALMIDSLSHDAEIPTEDVKPVKHNWFRDLHTRDTGIRMKPVNIPRVPPRTAPTGRKKRSPIPQPSKDEKFLVYRPKSQGTTYRRRRDRLPSIQEV